MNVGDYNYNYFFNTSSYVLKQLKYFDQHLSNRIYELKKKKRCIFLQKMSLHMKNQNQPPFWQLAYQKYKNAIFEKHIILIFLKPIH